MIATKATKEELHKLEREIQEVEGRFFEDFYYIGIRLKEIRENRLYEAEGFESWAEYCRSDRLEIQKSRATS